MYYIQISLPHSPMFEFGSDWTFKSKRKRIWKKQKSLFINEDIFLLCSFKNYISMHIFDDFSAIMFFVDYLSAHSVSFDKIFMKISCDHFHLVYSMATLYI